MNRPTSQVLSLPMKSIQRGISLIEVVLSLTVMLSVIGLVANMTYDESRRQEDVATAAQMTLLMNASQQYVASEYDNIRNQLLSAARTNGAAEISISMESLVGFGYLPDVYTESSANPFGQEYAILMRAVSVLDTAVPQVTMTASQIDADADGAIDPYLLDLNNSNDEMTIEAILVTSGGNPVPAHRGPPISVRTGKTTAGFVGSDGLARGPYGSFVFDVSGFADFPNRPIEGSFVNIIALSRFSTIDATGASNGGGVQDALQRCVGILDEPGQSPDTPLYQTCLSGQNVYNDIVFNSYDFDGDGIIDYVPGISNVGNINMAGGTDTTGDGFPDQFSAITGAYDITLGAPVDTTGDGNPDRFSGIRNVSRLDCAETTGISVSGLLVIDCDTIALNGNVNVQDDLIVGGNQTISGSLLVNADTDVSGNSRVVGDSTVGGDLIVAGDQITQGNQTAERFISSALGGQDLTEGIYNTSIVASGQTVDKPFCPPLSADGNFIIEPRIVVAPSAFSHPGGLPTVGIKAVTEDTSPTQWTVRLFNFVHEDFCTSSTEFPLTTMTGDFRSENVAACQAPDGFADVYEVSPNAGRIIAMTRCY